MTKSRRNQRIYNDSLQQQHSGDDRYAYVCIDEPLERSGNAMAVVGKFVFGFGRRRWMAHGGCCCIIVHITKRLFFSK
jgi:hypothetical protein